MGRMTSPLRQRVRQTISEALLDTAEREMIGKGYDRATMQGIASAAGCATGTFYLYFKNKEELFQAIVARHVTAMFGLGRQALNSEEDPLDKLRAAFSSFLHYVNDHQEFFKLVFTALPMRHRIIHQKLGRVSRQQQEDYDRVEADVLRQAQRQGKLRDDMEVEVLQGFMEAVAMSFVEEFVFSTSPPSHDEQLRVLWGLVTGGIGARSNL